ncbi:MAG TPA: tRNA (adenosine(37)-N6)-threonylcarbamoyltransferase complex dimerization subunit type 1 TsaB [Candidatus Dormibacteraeota bacterium]|nr:tRNA (adenosine(37)-N6)-threonylcarbamoyltransferase complex dimerization subunit type 1 TsaB [Candidatus Dormibacteraeota bacterium]
MVLVIDTSSSRSAIALVDGEGRALADDVAVGGREHDLPGRVLTLVEPRRLTAVAVAVGPGSFTGLRVGVSYGVGLAMGLDVPLLALGSLDVQAARARVPATPLVEAGRGRLYWRAAADEEPRLGEPAELPDGLPVVGWLREETAGAVRAAGARSLGDDELHGFAQAAALALGDAERVSYDTVRLRYMQSFRPSLA